MSHSRREFEHRINNIVQSHAQLGHGAVRSITADGLIVARPRRYRPRFPLKGMVSLILMTFVFKGLILAHLGPDAYNARLDSLAEASVLEQVGAVLMIADPATTVFAAGFAQILP